MGWDKGLDTAGIAYAIAAAPEPRVRVIAGPGTGKSFAMKRRVARLLESGTKPDEILAVTFTRVAAEDLHRELQKLGVPGCENLEGQTLHSLAMRILSRQHVLEALGRHPRPLNKFEVRALLCDLAQHNGGITTCKGFLKNYEAAWAQSQGDEPGFAKTEEEKRFQGDFLGWCEFHQSMTIGELIPYLVKYLKNNPGADEHEEFKHLLVDEYQDLNKAEQAAIAFLGATSEICIVGDDDQSIYSFKNAHPEGIREWKDIHPKCADLEMSDCHRCPTKVVSMANSLIGHNKNRVPRALKPMDDKGPGEIAIHQLKDLSQEAAWIAEKIKNLLASGVHPIEIIVLVQRSIAGKPILDSLKTSGIPAKSYYEESQLDSDIAQQRFALLKLVINSEDRVALRYLLGSGGAEFRAKSYARLRRHCEEHGDGPWAALQKIVAGELKLPYTSPLAEAFVCIQKQLEQLVALKDDLKAFVDDLLPESDPLLSELRALAIQLLPVSGSVEELFVGLMKEITQPDIPPAIEEVRIMSLHKSKGLSSPYVFIAGCVEGILPPAFDPKMPKVQRDYLMEEARRLFYVGITRVKADPKAGRPGNLTITYPKQMYVKQAYGANIAFQKKAGGYAQLLPSRFLDELGKDAPKPTIA